jgi:hypothetical protein
MAAMHYSVEGYEARAQECAALANQTTDLVVRNELLRLRQSYLSVAQRLRRYGFEMVPDTTEPKV